MEPTADISVRSESPLPGAELIVQNGRLKGTSKPLNLPITLVGRSAGCDMRLNVEGVSAVHCVLVHGPAGLVLKDLQSERGTLVNGRPASATLITNGDQLTIGPFQFL